jgi:hypothetical protein
MDAAAVPIDVPTAVLSARNNKRDRKRTAQVLPPGLEQSMMKKYVVYYRETVYLKNGKSQPREYFKVESHPRLTKAWVSSKSSKVSLLEKLAEANQFVSDLENTMDATPDADLKPDTDTNTLYQIKERWEKYLPKYTRIRVKKDTAIVISLLYDRKDTSNGFRWTAAYTFVSDQPAMNDDKATISLGLHHLGNKLREKYGADLLGL